MNYRNKFLEKVKKWIVNSKTWVRAQLIYIIIKEYYVCVSI